MNKLYFGDNHYILREHLRVESVDLIYLDSPFNLKRAYTRIYSLVAIIVSIIFSASNLIGQQRIDHASITHLDPPDAGFYTKRLDCSGIPIEASASVVDTALVIACDKISMMLAQMPAVRTNLISAGVAFRIIGRSQVTTDLPEYRAMKNKPRQAHSDEPFTDVDSRTRGLGGLVASCGEENLLRLLNDRYRGRDILVHEFAHSIFEIGLTDSLRNEVERQYRSSLKFWEDKYAHENPSEYFAELSMWYFGTHGDDPGHNVGVGKKALQKYDPNSYRIFDSLYSGKFTVSVDTSLIGDSVQLFSPISGLHSGNGQPCTLTVVNRLSMPISMFWIDFNGDRKFYEMIQPGARWIQKTFVSHLWIASDGQGHDLCEFVAHSKKNLAIIK